MPQKTDDRARPLLALVFACLVTTLAGSCGGGAGGPDVVQLNDDTAAADLLIAKAVYGISPRTPPGFYQESSAYPDRQTLTQHVRSSEIGLGGGVAFEVCSDDFAEAMSWSAASADALGYTTTLSGNSTTEWFFQFDREISATEPAMLVNRVFLCQSLDRSSVDDAGAEGSVNRRPLQPEDLRWLAEYLWSFSPYNNALHAVIESRGTTTAAHYQHSLVRAVAHRFAAPNGCDLIEVWSLDYVLDRQSGALGSSETWLRNFKARFESGATTLCED